MHTPWLGTRRIAVFPAAVNSPNYSPPPANWADLIRQRMYYDPDPATGVDRSLRGYIYAISYGRALLEADVLDPVTVPPCDIDAAIQANPTAHLYEYACVVFTANSTGCGGWAFWDNPPFPFSPARSPNVLRNWCRVNMGEPLGVWGMEVLHMTTAFGDLYNTNPNPGNFDNMACSCGTHPSTFTKLRLAWLDASRVVTVQAGSPASSFTLHAVGLLQPPPPGRWAAIRIPSTISQRYFLLEARLRVDPYERATPGVSAGIPSEGVVVYEIDEGAWPVQLRTPTALVPGQQFTNVAEQLTIDVASSVPGGFTVTVRSTENPACSGIRDEIAEANGEIASLQDDLQHASPGEKAAIVRQIRMWQAKRKSAQERGTSLGCRLSWSFRLGAGADERSNP